MKKFVWNKYFIFIWSVVMSLFLAACTVEEQVVVEEIETDIEWAIYWYLCGSDLETNYGAATTDLLEMLEVQLPENVKVIIQTGGSQSWQNDVVNPEVLGRYVYDHNGLELVEELPLANMGEKDTLKGFLEFARDNYPAKRTAVLFWNHGGGSVSGVAFDELFDNDSLSLPEIYAAFAEIFGENPEDPPIDIIGFDACLMATLDTAYYLSDIGKYLVASQEIEPGNGWLYSGWIGAAANNPEISALELAKVICDTYAQGSRDVGTEDIITLSVIDLTQISSLVTAYDDFGKEALAVAVENPAFFNHFSKIAQTVENYGGNTREQGFTNMADLGMIALKASDILPETSGALLDAIESTVAYKVNGKYRPESMGISSYYSYNGDLEDLENYKQIGPADSFKFLFEYGLTGGLSEEGMDYLSSMNYSELPNLMTLADIEWKDMPLMLDENGNATLVLGEEADDILSSITFELFYADVEEDILLSLGTDNDIYADWENGIFSENFQGYWGSLDGALCYMEIAYEGENFNQYAIPILLNGEDYNLIVVYDFETESYYIEGARKPISESGAADKNLRYLVEGDEIQTIHFVTSLSDKSEELVPVVIDTIVVTEDTNFASTELGDGLFILMFAMQDSQGNVVYSAAATYESINGEIFTTIE